MNEATKKRTIGVLVLIVIGVGLPFVLSHCLGGPAIDNTGQTREIDLNNSGSVQSSVDNAEAGDQKPKQSAPSNPGQSAQSKQTPPTSESARSSGARSVGQATSTGGEASSQPFQTPPVKGKQAGANAASAHNAASETGAGGGTASSSAANETTPQGGGKNAPAKPTFNKSRSTAESSNNGRGNASAGTATASSASGAGAGQPPGTSGKPAQTTGKAGHVRGGSGAWVVQVASFKSKKNARKLIQKLKKRYASFYATGEVNGSTWYRVRVGPFETHKAAERAAKDLAHGDHKPYVRRRSS